MKKILLPTDFSKNASNAIEYAVDLYKNEECEFYILNAFYTLGFATDNVLVPEIGEIAYKSGKNNSEKELSVTLKEIQKNNISRHRFFKVSKFNSLLNSIQETVEKENIDLIIMGTQGATNAVDKFLGSNTVMVMENVRYCPVMAIPSEVKYTKPKEIVFPTSYNTHYKRRELKQLIDITTITNAAIRILHIENEIDKDLNKTQNNNKELLEEYFEGLNYSFHVIYQVELEVALDCFVQSRNSDMIAFVNKKHGFLDSIFTNHLVQELGYKSKVPVLTMHDL